MESRCAFVAVVGEPNAGKSTLVNVIVGTKVSIVSPKVQTTRRQVRGIVELGEVQLVFVDTPGFCRPNSALERAISKNIKGAYKDADMILLLIDASSKGVRRSLDFLEKMKLTKIPFCVAINKVDIAKREDILKVAQALSAYDFIKRVFMVSARTGDGLGELQEFLCHSAPIGAWLFEPSRPTDASMAFQLAEITREKLFNHLQKELPYSVYVETEQMKETEKKASISQVIVVMKDSQKGIILGRAGGMIKTIKEEAVRGMRGLLGKKVDLTLFVKVKEKWTEKMVHLQNAGIVD
ncbi:MAG: GTPase Era [Alphaproteobacteria bacterium]|nr:GTPase Era [Alphaproteobacteria bacterium]